MRTLIIQNREGLWNLFSRWAEFVSIFIQIGKSHKHSSYYLPRIVVKKNWCMQDCLILFFPWSFSFCSLLTWRKSSGWPYWELQQAKTFSWTGYIHQPLFQLLSPFEYIKLIQWPTLFNLFSSRYLIFLMRRKMVQLTLMNLLMHSTFFILVLLWRTKLTVSFQVQEPFHLVVGFLWLEPRHLMLIYIGFFVPWVLCSRI